MKRILAAGLLGGVVMIAWLFVVDGIFGFKRRIDMNPIANERAVYSFLTQHITAPGRFVINPEVLPEQRYPGAAPIFAVHYSGLGHDDAGQEVILGLVVAFLAPLAGAWLLANAANRIAARYGSRLRFFATIGVVATLLGVAARFGIASYPLGDTIAWGLHDLAAWVLAGLVVARIVRPALPG